MLIISHMHRNNEKPLTGVPSPKRRPFVFNIRGNQTGPDGTVSHSNKSQVTPFKTMDLLDLCEQVGGLVEEKCQIVGNYVRPVTDSTPPCYTLTA
ncbi:hypothetical protein RUM43_004767 [Polyplax serrata]|uniref:Uncharacterized protein n=1 Tax=Polyplax serrata TaxID=468196 RepID=A0AAN8SBB0_POLSC